MTRRTRILNLPIALAAVGALLAGCSEDTADAQGDARDTGSDSSSSPAAASPRPAGVKALPEKGADSVLDAGRYRVPLNDNLAYEIDLPQGTLTDGDPLYIQADKTIIKSEIAGNEYGIPTDPCGAYGDIDATGPTVEDLVTAIRNEPTYQVDRPRPVTIDGAPGQHLQIRIPAGYDATDCTDQQLGLPGNPVTNNNMEPGYLGHWWILDVDGQRVVLQTLCAGCDTDAAAAFNDTIESITFTTTQ